MHELLEVLRAWDGGGDLCSSDDRGRTLGVTAFELRLDSCRAGVGGPGEGAAKAEGEALGEWRAQPMCWPRKGAG